jgi:hypothetical protein
MAWFAPTVRRNQLGAPQTTGVICPKFNRPRPDSFTGDRDFAFEQHLLDHKRHAR